MFAPDGVAACNCRSISSQPIVRSTRPSDVTYGSGDATFGGVYDVRLDALVASGEGQLGLAVAGIGGGASGMDVLAAGEPIVKIGALFSNSCGETSPVSPGIGVGKELSGGGSGDANITINGK